MWQERQETRATGGGHVEPNLLNPASAEHQTSYYLFSSSRLLLLHQNTTRKTEDSDQQTVSATVTQLRLLACLAQHRLATSFTQGGDRLRPLPGIKAWLEGCGPLTSSYLLVGVCSCILPMVGEGGQDMYHHFQPAQKADSSAQSTHTVTFLSFLLHSPTNFTVLALLLLKHLLSCPPSTTGFDPWPSC